MVKDDFYINGKITARKVFTSLAEPSFTYSSGVLTRIDYPDGSYKEFTYNIDGTLDEIDLDGKHTKSLVWSDGLLQSIGVA